MLAEKLPDDVWRQVARDRVRMLYAQAPGAIVVSIAASVGLVVSASHDRGGSAYWWWAGIMIVLMALRGILLAAFLRAEASGRIAVLDDVAAPPGRAMLSLSQWERAYAALALLSGLQFALWPLLFFPELSVAHRLTGALILGAIAGGSIALLSIVRWLALAYGALLLLPGSAMLIMIGGVDERICGALGFIFWLAMLYAVGRTHRHLRESLEFSHRNALLVAQMDRQSQALLDANLRLASAQEDMRRTNQALEQRIVERTAELHRLATRDSLTGLANRARLIEIAEECLRPGRPPMALYFVDLDGFKEINDSMGHAVGDSVLAEVARRLGATVQDALALARWGGDEFLILRRREADDDAQLVYAEALIEALRDPVEDRPYSVRVDASIGIANWPQDGDNLQELIYGADLAVYAAKAAGRGKVRAFSDALAEVGRRRAQIRKALALCLTEGCQGLSLVYQPVFDLRARRVASVEALLRWRHAELGDVSPAEFVPLAENSGDIIALGDWVLHEACRFAAGFEPQRLPSVAVNVSVQQLLYPGFVDQVRTVLSDTGLVAERLTLELTESIFIHDHEQIAPVFAALHAAGVRIAIDDFGTGYSSLAYLQRVPASALKVDGSFVAALEGGGGPIIEASVSLANAFGMDVIAEGVETEAQLRALSALGIDRVQGYLLARPKSADDTRAWLLAEARLPAFIA